MPDSFRKLSELTTPGRGYESWGVIDQDTGECRSIKIEEIYARLERLELHEGVPEEVHKHFDTSRNLYLYSWFVYRFISVAEWHASATLELALKIKTEGKIRFLPNLIEHAIENGWVKNEGFSVWQSAKERFKQNNMVSV